MFFDFIQGGELFRKIRQDEKLPNDLGKCYATEVILAI